MGGFIAYWIASYHPELVGPVIVVDAGPALSGDLDEAKALRARLEARQRRRVHRRHARPRHRMTSVPRKMASGDRGGDPLPSARDRDATLRDGDTDLTITSRRSPAVLVIAADGGFQRRIRAQIETIPDHAMIVLPHTRTS